MSSATTIKEVLHPDTFGLVALVLISQIGSRLIVDEAHLKCGEILDNPIVKTLVLYSILYLATKDKLISVCWTFGVIVIWQMMINGPGKNYCKRARDGEHSFRL